VLTQVAFSTRLAATPRHPLVTPNPSCGGWDLTTYDACEFRCVYCITGVQGVSTPRLPREEVRGRLLEELRAVPRDARISVGGLCDAYPTPEREHRVTRAALGVLVDLDLPFSIVTKSTLVMDDLDLFASYRSASVAVSLCSVDEARLRSVDPRAPSAAARLDVVHRLAAAGVKVAVSAAPWIPGVTDADALVEHISPDIPVWFAPLNVLAPEVSGSAYGRRFSQREVNEAYVQASRRIGRRANVRWLRPVPLADPLAPGALVASPVV